MMSAPSDPALGGCLCGAVRFSAKAPYLFCAHCHCEWCRRAHGAAFVTWLGVRDDAFAITSGEAELRWYRSSQQSERAFCINCGTTMLFRSALAPGEMHVALACMDTQVEHAPSVHVFFDSHVPWFAFGDDLPRADRNAKGLTKYQVIATSPLTTKAAVKA